MLLLRTSLFLSEDTTILRSLGELQHNASQPEALKEIPPSVQPLQTKSAGIFSPLAASTRKEEQLYEI